MDHYLSNPEIPMGLGMALAQNVSAMERFAAMSESRAAANRIADALHRNPNRECVILSIKLHTAIIRNFNREPAFV